MDINPYESPILAELADNERIDRRAMLCLLLLPPIIGAAVAYLTYFAVGFRLTNGVYFDGIATAIIGWSISFVIAAQRLHSTNS